MAKLSSLATDPDLERDGVWVEYDNGIECRISRITLPEFTAYMRKQAKPHRKATGGARKRHRISEEKVVELSKEGIARFILRDWSGVDKDDAEPVGVEDKEASGHNNWREGKDGKFIEQQPYTWELGLKLLEDDEYQDFFNWIVRTANNHEYYRRDIEEESAGN